MDQRTTSLTLNSSGAARASGALFAVLVSFQMALALGAPWGSAAWGGADTGQLSTPLRVASAVSAVIWAGVAVLVGTQVLASRWHRRLLGGLIAVCVLSAVMNLASPSPVERIIWTPFALVQIALLWRARREEAR